MVSMVPSKALAYAQLLRIDKPVGTLLLLWPTLWAIWIASNGSVDNWILLVFILGTWLMRSAGCAINDIADRKFDGRVLRTKDRPIPSGRVTTLEAASIASILIFIAFVLVLTLNTLAIQLSFLALFLAASYPFTKRFFVMPQAYLGFAFGFGIPMAWAAILNVVSLEALVMLLANVFWAIAYDTEYAMVDRHDDERIGIKTSAILFGDRDIFFVCLCHAIFVLIMTIVGIMSGLGLAYYLALTAAVILICLQYPLIKNREREKCFRAFQQNNWIGGVIFFGLVLDKF